GCVAAGRAHLGQGHGGSGGASHHPVLGRVGAGDAGFSGDVSDGPAVGQDAGDEPVSSFRGQRVVSIGAGLFLLDGCFDTTHRAVQRPVPSSPVGDYNVMTHNT